MPSEKHSRWIAIQSLNNLRRWFEMHTRYKRVNASGCSGHNLYFSPNRPVSAHMEVEKPCIPHVSKQSLINNFSRLLFLVLMSHINCSKFLLLAISINTEVNTCILHRNCRSDLYLFSGDTFMWPCGICTHIWIEI